MATGSLTIKNDKYYAVISFYEEVNGVRKRKQKWISLDMLAKSGKKKAQRKMNEILLDFEKRKKKTRKTSILSTQYSNGILKLQKIESHRQRPPSIIRYITT